MGVGEHELLIVLSGRDPLQILVMSFMSLGLYFPSFDPFQDGFERPILGFSDLYPVIQYRTDTSKFGELNASTESACP